MNRQLLGHLAALFTIINWGTTFIGTKILLRAFAPVEILVFRFLLGVLILCIVCPRPLRVGNVRRELVFASAGLTGVCLYFLMENIALSYTTAANVGVIVSAAPMFTALFAWWAAGNAARPGPRFFMGFVTAMAGICLISFSGLSDLSGDWRGNVLAVGASIVWGGYSVLVNRINSFGYPVLQATRRIFIYGLAFMIPVVLLMDFRLDLARFENPLHVGLFLYLGLGACALCFVVWAFAVSVLGAVKTSVYLYLVPVITLLCAAIILDERLTPVMLVGTALTLLGLALSHSQKHGKAGDGVASD